MKKSTIFVLISITLVFASYVGGFYAGRNYSFGSTQILGLLPESTQPITSAATTAVAPPTSTATIGTSPTEPYTSGTTPLPTDPTIPSATEPIVPPATEPVVPPATEPAVPPATEPAVPGLINVNTATLEQLDTLPGIGPKLAQAIIDYRTEYGNFEVPEDLLHVPGIGEKKLAAIIDLITTGG